MMKRNSLYGIVFLFLWAVTSCVTLSVVDGEGAEKIIAVSFPEDAMMDYDSLFEVRHVIPLETEEYSLISGITEICMTDSVFLIYSSSRQQILLFASDGTYLREIGRRGDGPEEFSSLDKVSLADNKIYVHDRVKNKMLIYDLNGRLLQKQDCRFAFNSFCKIPESGYWLYTNMTRNNPDFSNLMRVDTTLTEMEYEFFSQNPYFVDARFGSPGFDVYRDTIYFYYPGSNHIYRLQDSVPRLQYTVDLGKHTPDYEKISQMTCQEEYWKFMEDNGYASFDNVLVWKDLVIFTYSLFSFKPSRSYRAIYDRARNRLYEHFGQRTRNIFWGHAQWFGHTDDYLVFVVPPHQLPQSTLDYINTLGTRQVTRDSNPVIVLADVKR